MWGVVGGLHLVVSRSGRSGRCRGGSGCGTDRVQILRSGSSKEVPPWSGYLAVGPEAVTWCGSGAGGWWREVRLACAPAVSELPVVHDGADSPFAIRPEWSSQF